MLNKTRISRIQEQKDSAISKSASWPIQSGDHLTHNGATAEVQAGGNTKGCIKFMGTFVQTHDNHTQCGSAKRQEQTEQMTHVTQTFVLAMCFHILVLLAN